VKEESLVPDLVIKLEYFNAIFYLTFDWNREIIELNTFDGIVSIPSRGIRQLMNQDINFELLNIIQDGDFEKVKTLLQAGANINAITKFKHTPLMLAARDGYEEVVDFLITQGADIHATDSLGHTAYSIAVINHRYKIAEKLKSSGTILV
jgi:ankyrin repeat protein